MRAFGAALSHSSTGYNVMTCADDMGQVSRGETNSRSAAADYEHHHKHDSPSWSGRTWLDDYTKGSASPMTTTTNSFNDMEEPKAPSRSPTSSTTGSTRRRGRGRASTDTAVSAESSSRPRAAHSSSRRSSHSHRRRTSIQAGSPNTYRVSSPLYRSTSTPAWNVEDAIALHQRSCAVFQNTSASDPPSPRPLTPRSVPETASPPSPTDLGPFRSALHFPPSPQQQQQQQQQQRSEKEATPDADAEEEQPYIAAPVTIHWTSAATRAQEYAEIDRWATGVRGFWRRVAPRWFFRKARLRFYDEAENASEAGSVRRYRIDVPGAVATRMITREEGDEDEEEGLFPREKMGGGASRRERLDSEKMEKKLRARERSLSCF